MCHGQQGLQLGFNDGKFMLALQGANTYLCWLLSHVAGYLGLRILRPTWISGL